MPAINIPIFSTATEVPKSDVQNPIKLNERDEFLDYLLTTRMDPENHIPCFRRMLTCQADDSVPAVFKRLSREGFTSAPVRRGTEYVGFVDLLDMVKFTTNMFWGATSEEWIDFWSKEEEFENASVDQVMGERTGQKHWVYKRPSDTTGTTIKQPSWTRMRVEPLYQDNSTFHALEIMSQANVHRVPIFDNRADNNLVGIYTQSMLISECYQRMHLLGNLRNRKVRDMTGFYADVVTVRDTSKAINAFNMIANQDISGLAVVDSDGTLVDSISIKDLRGVGADGKKFSRLFDTVKSFKDKVRIDFPIAAPRAHYSRNLTPGRRQPIYVTPDQTFLDVLQMMDDGNIHRVFVCSTASVNRGKPSPTHVITQTDMLKQIMWQYTGKLV